MSKNYMKVKNYYDTGKWNTAQVQLAVGRWITEEEFHMIVDAEPAEE